MYVGARPVAATGIRPADPFLHKRPNALHGRRPMLRGSDARSMQADDTRGGGGRFDVGGLNRRLRLGLGVGFWGYVRGEVRFLIGRWLGVS